MRRLSPPSCARAASTHPRCDVGGRSPAASSREKSITKLFWYKFGDIGCRYEVPRMTDWFRNGPSSNDLGVIFNDASAHDAEQTTPFCIKYARSGRRSDLAGERVKFFAKLWRNMQR